MSYPQFGYPYSSTPQFLMTTNSLSTCCESSGRTLSDTAAAASAQTPVYCPVYESRLLATARHELNSAAALGVYGNPYTGSQGYGNYVTYGTDASAFYSLNTFESKDGTGSAHAGIAQTAAYYPYDHTLSQYQYDRYGTIDGGTRRKNATRETTSTLKAWLQEHRKNPYPTKGEKIMLAIITKMTLTQVSTWFANARRRLKKENKMTWAPRNKSEDEDEEDGDGERSKEEQRDKIQDSNETSAEDEGISLHVDSMTDHSCSAESDGEKLPCRPREHLCESGTESKDKYEDEDDDEDIDEEDRVLPVKPVTSSPLTGIEAPVLNHQHEGSPRNSNKSTLDNRISPSSQTQASKPKLWSLAEIATSDVKHQNIGQSCQPSAVSSATSSAASHNSAYPSSSILGRHIYYTSPFYSNYTNYGNFNALQSQGILRYNSTTVTSNEGLNQAVLNSNPLHKHTSDSKTSSSQLDQHYRSTSYESKKDPTEVCTVGVQPYL